MTGQLSFVPLAVLGSAADIATVQFLLKEYLLRITGIESTRAVGNGRLFAGKQMALIKYMYAFCLCLTIEPQQ
jgi:hypothetical protein